MTGTEIWAGIIALMFFGAAVLNWIDSWRETPKTAKELAELEKERLEKAEEAKQQLESLKTGLGVLQQAGADSSAKVAKMKQEIADLKKEDEAYKKKIAGATEEELKGELKKNGYEEKDFE